MAVSLWSSWSKIDAMMQYDDPKDSHHTRKGTLYSCSKIFRGQQDLLAQLRSHIEPWVVSTSAEDIVRMVVDLKYGLHLKPENVIGVNLLLAYPTWNHPCSAEERKNGKRGEFFRTSESKSYIDAYLYAPMTWYAGKLQPRKWIILLKTHFGPGDSPNEFFMQFYTDVREQEIRLKFIAKNHIVNS